VTNVRSSASEAPVVDSDSSFVSTSTKPTAVGRAAVISANAKFHGPGQPAKYGAHDAQHRDRQRGQRGRTNDTRGPHVQVAGGRHHARRAAPSAGVSHPVLHLQRGHWLELGEFVGDADRADRRAFRLAARTFAFRRVRRSSRIVTSFCPDDRRQLELLGAGDRPEARVVGRGTVP